jgi:hypothetical protein
MSRRAPVLFAVLAVIGSLTSAVAVTPVAAATPVVELTGSSASMDTSQFVDDTTKDDEGSGGDSFLSFGDSIAPATLSATEGTASAFASQASTLETPGQPPLPVSPLNDIAMTGSATSAATATGQGTAVPVAFTDGSFTADFRLAQDVPAFFSGFMQTTETDPDSCSFVSVDVVGSNSFHQRFIASTPNNCNEDGSTRQRGWAESLTLPAGEYNMQVVYDTEVSDALPQEPASMDSSAKVTLNLAFVPPTARFTTKISGSKATFDGATSSQGGAQKPLAKWRWTFGDGKTATTTTSKVTHTYAASPTRAPAYAVTLQVLEDGQAISAPVTHRVLGTVTTVAAAKTRAKLNASGAVGPRRGGHQVAVTLARRVGGKFRVLATHRPTLTSTSKYLTTFARPARGTCRLTTKYAGDSSHLASSRSVTFAC